MFVVAQVALIHVCFNAIACSVVVFSRVFRLEVVNDSNLDEGTVQDLDL